MRFLFLLTILFGSTSFAFTPYLGLNGAYNQSKGVSGEDDKSGLSLGAKILGSFEFDSFYLDGTLGYQMMNLQSNGIRIETKSALIELDARYKLSNSWSLGPVIRVLSGTDNSNTEFIGSDSNTTQLMGKLMYQTKWGSFPARWELALGTSMGLDRSLSTALVGFQIGLPQKETPKPSVITSPTYTRVSPPKEEVPDIRVNLKMARIRFDTNKATINSLDEGKLRQLAEFLKENDQDWERVKFGGHTDIRGELDRNKRLSQERAEVVMNIFVEMGVDGKKMSANGYGSSYPVDDRNIPEAWEKNRRTEIEFFGVKNREEFNKKLMKALE